jgi:hypothetical protein
MQFLVKTISATILGMVGGWLGSFIGLGTSLMLGFFLSIVGWYLAKHLWNEYLE